MSPISFIITNYTITNLISQMNTHIYLHSDTCRWQLDQLNISYETRCFDIDLFCNIQYSRKVAILQVPFPYDFKFEEIVDLLLPHCESIIILCSELHQTTIDFITGYDYPNINYFICGFLNKKLLHSQVSTWMDWFITSTHFYKNNNILDQLNPYQVKDKYFDILLGQPKLHRTYIFNEIHKSNLSDQVIMTYLQDFTKPLHDQDLSGWKWEMEGLTLPDSKFKWTVTPVTYYGQHMSLSQVIPIKIYNQTAYSIIAETNFENYYTFFTEKTVKPILAKRLFIAFAGQYFLQNLRKLGFKTFDGILDESYDLIENPQLRFDCAFSQIEYLITQPQEEILSLIKPIVEHNQQLMLNTDWLECFNKEFFQCI